MDEDYLPVIYPLTQITGRRAQDERIHRPATFITLRGNEGKWLLVAALAALIAFWVGSLLGSGFAAILASLVGAATFIYLTSQDNASMKGKARAAVISRLKARPGHVYQSGIEVFPGKGRAARLCHSTVAGYHAGVTPPHR